MLASARGGALPPFLSRRFGKDFFSRRFLAGEMVASYVNYQAEKILFRCVSVKARLLARGLSLKGLFWRALKSVSVSFREDLLLCTMNSFFVGSLCMFRSHCGEKRHCVSENGESKETMVDGGC